ncbi:MAG: RluA family pseudouridine synthase [Candidatus Gracilibacteria bacterium]|jgi:23S rRNA pseudouridine1911/1915/1917 synthase
MKKIKKPQILYKNKDVLVINKPAGMIVHPQNENDERGSVSEIFVDDKKVAKNACIDNLRPGIVHRLDMGTSGALILARNKKSYVYFVDQFKKRKITKMYLALVFGKPQYPEGIIDSPIGRGVRDRQRMAVSYEDSGKEAITHYKTLSVYKFDKYVFSLLEVDIKTGRTHQIRVHMAAIGNPVLGDNEYGNKKINAYLSDKMGLNRQFLHAKMIKFKLLDGKDVSVTAKLPSDLAKTLRVLGPLGS